MTTEIRREKRKFERKHQKLKSQLDVCAIQRDKVRQELERIENQHLQVEIRTSNLCQQTSDVQINSTELEQAMSMLKMQKFQGNSIKNFSHKKI